VLARRPIFALLLSAVIVVSSLGAAYWLYSVYEGETTAQPAQPTEETNPAGGTGPVGSPYGRGDSPDGATHEKAGWQNPLALLVATLGLGAALTLGVVTRTSARQTASD
jgi:hypothetical protein